MVVIWQVFLIYSLNVSGDLIRCSGELSEWPTKQKAERWSTMSCCGNVSKVDIMLSSFNLQGFGKEAFFIFSHSKSEGWEKNWKH